MAAQKWMWTRKLRSRRLKYNPRCLLWTCLSPQANPAHVSGYLSSQTRTDDCQDTYTLLLPENLPPTFRGRSLKISYELVIGTCRASTSAMRSSSSLGPTGANSTSRVMKVPIRVYNNVTSMGCFVFRWRACSMTLIVQSGKYRDPMTFYGLWQSDECIPWKLRQR
jgi:hypothetical protein